MPNPSKRPRKNARQARSKRTVDAIHKAAAHILKQDGVTGFTTNHVAKEANISVGSIYQYYPNKEAILLRLMRGHIERANTLRPKALDAGDTISLAERIKTTVAWHLDVLREDPLLATRLSELQREVLTNAERKEFDRYHEESVRAGLSHHRKEIKIRSLDTAALIVSQILLATTQSATAIRTNLLNDRQYEAEIVAALLSYLRSDHTDLR